jgi:archaellum component FlaC
MEDCNIVSKEQLVDLTISINFMSKQFNDFKIQIRNLVNSAKEIKEKNRYLKEQNIKLKSEVALVNKRINIIEQEQIIKYIELIGLPDQKMKIVSKLLKIFLWHWAGRLMWKMHIVYARK